MKVNRVMWNELVASVREICDLYVKVTMKNILKLRVKNFNYLFSLKIRINCQNKNFEIAFEKIFF